MPHTVAATVAFIALGVWPALSADRAGDAPLLRGFAPVGASVALLGLVVWFAAELHGGQRGLAERAAVGAQALWPLAVVVTTRRALTRRGWRGAVDHTPRSAQDVITVRAGPGRGRRAPRPR